MSVQLTIEDGVPWYLSPDIWVVPGNDPNGAVGLPVVNMSCYVWARVQNRGSSSVSNATVKYYWADPSMVISPTTANHIGTSYVNLGPGETKQVLCLTTWTPIWVNNGHECLIVEAFSSDDPVLHGPTDEFNAEGDRHVAQRNIGILNVMTKAKIIVYPFAARNTIRLNSDKIILRAKVAPIKLLEKLRGILGLKELPDDIGQEIKEFGIQQFKCGDQITEVGNSMITLDTKGHGQYGMALVIKIPKQFDAKKGALFLVEQVVKEKVVGGISALIMFKEEVKTGQYSDRREDSNV